MKPLTQLQNWYLNQCNGEWEHDSGIKINTLDNPGWMVMINLAGTKIESAVFQKITMERNENDWLTCWVDNKTFNVACGPLNLEEALKVFLKWAQKRKQ